MVRTLQAVASLRPDTSSVGHPAVASSLDAFFSHWDQNAQQAEQTVEQLGERLVLAADLYTHTDNTAVQAFGG